MSQVYSTEPPTSATVIFETTYGPLSIDLWCKECPRTTQYFLQLCADGFYNNLPFHRIVPNFLIQTGDAKFRINNDNDNNNNDVQLQDQKDNSDDDNDNDASLWKQPPPPKYREQYRATEALERRRYEVNSRIRFNHRGQVACALGLDDDTTNTTNDDNGNDDDANSSLDRLQPQFFITLGEASHLDGKHIIFGSCTGPTIFNALRIGRIDVINNNDDDDDDDNDIRNFQPRLLLEAPRILRTKIVHIDTSLRALVPTLQQNLLPWKKSTSTIAAGVRDPNQIQNGKANNRNKKKKKKVRKGIKNVNLLSFGDDEEESNEENNDKKRNNNNNNPQIQSSHEVLGPSLSSSRQQQQQHQQGKNDISSMTIQPSSTSRSNNRVVGELLKEEAENENEDEGLSTTEKKERKKKQKNRKGQESGTTENNVDSFVLVPVLTTTKNDDVNNNDTTTYGVFPVEMELSTPTNTSSSSTSESNNEPSSSLSKKIITNHHHSTSNNKTKKISLVEARRAKYLKNNSSNNKGRKNHVREDETMTKLKAFQQKITRKEAVSVSVVDISNAATTTATTTTASSDWMNTKFKCKKHMDQDAKTGGDGRGIDEYEVIEEKSAATDRKHGKRKKHRRH